MNAQAAIKNYLTLRKQAEEIAEAKAAAEQALKEAFAKANITSAIDQAEGVKVSLVQGERPNYDSEALTELADTGVLAFEVYAKVTKVSVDGPALKAAVKVGLLDETIADKITTVTPYEQIRVSKV